MGYLQIATSSLTNFSKAVISLWFRVPAATLAAATAMEIPEDSDDDGWCGAAVTPPLVQIIPLITFGSIEETLATSDGGSGRLCNPSFIGVDCSDIVGVKTSPTLAVNLQTPVSCSFSKTPQDEGLQLRPECYYMEGIGSEPYSGDDLQSLFVTADTWHHILISFDIGHGCDITWANATREGFPDFDRAYEFNAASLFYWAFDDVGKTGFSTSPSNANSYTYDAPESTAPPLDRISNNLIIPQGLFTTHSAADQTHPLDDPTDFTVTVASSVIASNGNAIGIPTSASLVDNVYKVEMAELQIFTGVCVDVTTEPNRRAFITEDGSPATMSLAEALLGQPPDIKLHTSASWIAGINSGGLGTNFDATGTITTFSPDP